MRTPLKNTWRTRPWLGLTGAVIAAVAGFTVFAAIGDDGRINALNSERVVATRAACEQWLDQPRPEGSPGPRGDWCADLGHWMHDELAGASGMRSRMWESAGSLAGTCRAWVDTTAADEPTAMPTPAHGWCGHMARWMGAHMERWLDLDDWDHHMGDGHWRPNR